MQVVDLKQYGLQAFDVIHTDEARVLIAEYRTEREGPVQNVVLHTLNRLTKEMRELPIPHLRGNALYNRYILEGNDLTIAWLPLTGKYRFYRVDLLSGDVRHLYDAPYEAIWLEFFDGRHAFLQTTTYGVRDGDDEPEFDMRGAYERSLLLDLDACRDYAVQDEHLRLMHHGGFEFYERAGERMAVYKECYMETWELEAIWNGYETGPFDQQMTEEAVGIAPVRTVIEEMKRGTPALRFDMLHQTKGDGWTRYFGMDEFYVYIASKCFSSGLTDVYAIDKQTLEKTWLRTLAEEDGRTVRGCLAAQPKLFEKDEPAGVRVFREIFPGEREVRVPTDMQEELTFWVENLLVTHFFTQAENGDEYKEWTAIRDLARGEQAVFNGACQYIDDGLLVLGPY